MLQPLGRVRSLQTKPGATSKRFVLEVLCSEPDGGLVKVCFTRPEWDAYEESPGRMDWLLDPLALPLLILAS